MTTRSYVHFESDSGPIMIVPQYWAESRRQHRDRKGQVTVRRFGWSDISHDAAQAHADERVEAALREVLAGKRLWRREPKVPYNGAEGVPIREEIVGRHGSVVLTRNSYGAVCLNVPDVLFADVDFSESRSSDSTIISLLFALLAAVGVTWSVRTHPRWLVLLIWAYPLWIIASELARWVRQRSGFDEERARRRIARFLDTHPEWSARVYRTPNGLRLLATHRTFDPYEAEVAEFFRAVGVDPLYARMCTRQMCFRARLTAKPWRIGIGKHLGPRPGVWPINPARISDRMAWLAHYDDVAAGFAACAFVESLGSGAMDSRVRPVVDLHDGLSGATSGRPIA